MPYPWNVWNNQAAIFSNDWNDHDFNYYEQHGGNYYEQPGRGGMFGNQFQIRQAWENQANNGYQHQVVAYSYQNQGVSMSVSYQRGGYARTYSYHRTTRTWDQNRNYPRAKRTRWDRPPNENRLVPYNRSNQRRIIHCYNCDQIFTTYKALYEHRDAQHPKQRSFYCSICNKECPSHALLKKHELGHTMNACQKCPETFKYKESLIAHVKHAHPVQPPALPAIAEDSGTEADQGLPHQSNSSAPDHQANEKMEKSGKSSFIEPSAASTPIAEKKNLTSASDGDSGVKTENLSGVTDNSDSAVKPEQFKCPHCIKSFDSEQRMNSHCKIHTEADPDYDGSSQTGKSLLERPTLEKSVLACPFCIKKFPDKRGLTIHMSSVHTQSFYCPKCPAEFSSQNELTAHQNSCN